MEGRHRPHVLFSGTRIVRVEHAAQFDSAPSSELFPALPGSGTGSSSTPWLVARVLRTGYFSTQVGLTYST